MYIHRVQVAGHLIRVARQALQGDLMEETLLGVLF